MPRLEGKTVIVTGASAGIGKAAAMRLAKDGARLVLVGRRLQLLEKLKHELESKRGNAVAQEASQFLVVQADITQPQARETIIQRALEVFERIDGLVNNAGFGQRGPVEQVPVEAVRRNFETNLFSLIALTQLVIPIMRDQGSGRIVNVGSVAGKIARPFSSVYDATKHALEAITDGLRGELALFGIQVALIQPGFILTEFLDVASRISRPVLDNAGPYAPYLQELSSNQQKARKFAGQPEQIAELIFRALTDKHPRFRYAGPRHAHLFLAMKRFMPEKWFDSIALRSVGLGSTKRPPKHN